MIRLSGLVASLREEGILVRFFSHLPDAMRITVGTDDEVDALLNALDAAVQRGG